ncbi:translesion DNA synthesis-associated protein ImuA [Ideonella sp. A 288]|uniref:translesion DNA synthesis-associated protein ImuA n=1 Tax=Ideonella sp. A 288 TaxID=1962181 RepID=UPI001F36959C|nr:translesion DNA synthesis-associated protein ImuA [Ideonella sp. A 288]
MAGASETLHPAPFTGAPETLHPVPFAGAPEALHPALWRAHQLGAGVAAVTPTGFAALDAQLPGGGWPHRVLTELLLPHPGLGEMRLLAPALAACSRGGEPGAGGTDAGAGRCVMLFDPPAALCGWALGQLGLDARQWLLVQGRAAAGRPGGGAPNPRLASRLGPGADVLWALEQALRSGHLGAALAWLPVGLKVDVLRRLQLAAQAHDAPVFILREAEARHRPSVAPLRLLLAPAGIDTLSVRVLKRRGPPLAEPLLLALAPVLSPRQRDRLRPATARPASPRPARVDAVAGLSGVQGSAVRA